MNLPSTHAHHLHRFGPRVSAGGVEFRLWAPGARRVRVVLDKGQTTDMHRQEDGTWEAFIKKAWFGTRYRFDVDGQYVPDPASRFQPQDVDGQSEVADSNTYVWQNEHWRGRPWHEAVLYELHLGILGGYNGARQYLSGLAGLGVTAVEIMPIGDFAGARNWGYDGVLPFAPDSSYGTPDELRALIDAAHGHGLMVFLDVVYNHFGPAGNWLPSYAPEFFDEERHTPWGAGIDFNKPEVRAFFEENARYWLEAFRFDGLRFDAVHAIPNRAWLAELARGLRAALPERHVHLVLENEDNCASLLEGAYDAQWNDDFHNTMHVLLTDETHAYYADFGERPAERLARCLSEGFVYQGETAAHLGRPRGEKSGHLRPTAFVSFLQNHDQVGNRALGERLTQLANPRALRAAMALLLLCPQIPMLFMGEEVGAVEPFLFFTDFHGQLGKAVREGRRREFAGSPGFSDAEDTAAIPDPNELATFERSRWTDGAPDAADWRTLIGGLLRLRHERIVPHLPDTLSLGAAAIGSAAVLARWRLGMAGVLIIAANFGKHAVSADLPAAVPIFGTAAARGSLDARTTLVWITQ